MNVSLKWLKEFVDIDLGVDELAHQLTMLGLEIEAVDRPGAGITKVVIGRILKIKPHPDADKLVVCQTDVGQATPLQIVCGSRNMKAGDRAGRRRRRDFVRRARLRKMRVESQA